MISSDKCYLKDKCKKYKNNNCDSEFCIKLFKVNELLDLSLLSDEQKKYKSLFVDSDGTDIEVFTKLKEYEKSIDVFVSNGNNLYIHSNLVGNGKTSWAIRLIQAFINKEWYKSDVSCRALFINVPRYLLSLKDSISNANEYIEHIKRYILSADIVVWDEIGIKELTTFEHENLLNLINTRLDYGKSNIYTSNLSGDELRITIGERLYSRIVNSSIDIELKGKDKRGLGTITDIK